MIKNIKEKFKTIDYKKAILKMFVVLIGTFLVAFGQSVFLVPFDVISGGLSGLGIILGEFIPIGIDIIILILTWFLFFLGLIFLGIDFAFKTLLSTIFYPIFIMISLRTGLGEFIVNLIVNEGVTITEVSDVLTLNGLENFEIGRLIICAILGGGLVGFGCAVTFLGEGSTGGIDILCFIINKYLGIKTSVSSFVIDGLIVVVGLIINIAQSNSYGFMASLVGMLSALIASFVIEFVYVRQLGAYYCEVITSKSKEIKDFVINKMDRSVTIYDVIGGYSNEKKKCVKIIFSREELIKIKDLIAEIDPQAFMIIGECQNVNGEGFRPLKSSKENTITHLKSFIEESKEEEKEGGE